MRPSPDSFHALARSSPWRWSRLHLRHRSGSAVGSADREVEAWLTRPDGVRVVDSDGSVSQSLATQRRDGAPTKPWRPPEPTYRPDGLVERRPGGWPEDHELGEGLFWHNYFWVAMLDPVELSHHVRVDDVGEDDVAGRPVWRARLTAEPGYEPRCGGNCCELLYSEVGLRSEIDPSRVPESWRGRTYPDAHDVALDVGTGVVVRLHPLGGDGAAPWLENDIVSAH